MTVKKVVGNICKYILGYTIVIFVFCLVVGAIQQYGWIAVATMGGGALFIFMVYAALSWGMNLEL